MQNNRTTFQKKCDISKSVLKIHFSTVFIFLVAALGTVVINCASTKPEISPKDDKTYINKDLEALTDLWLKQNPFRDREQILKVLERRHAINAPITEKRGG